MRPQAHGGFGIVSILPVIDLKDGLVVRGIGGKRNEYQPIQSKLCSDAHPATVAKALANAFGFESIYVADLDAIAGKTPHWKALQQISACGFRIWIDAGLSGPQDVAGLLGGCEANVDLGAVIVALESIHHPSLLAEVAAAINDFERAVFSLDLKHGRPLTTSNQWQEMPIVEIADLAVQIGFKRMIALDLGHVGSGKGPGLEKLCRDLRAAHPTCELTSGGGVRDLEDVTRLVEAGCDNVLVASALHDGRINPASS